MDYQIEHVVSSQCEIGEGPIWSVSEQRLYWVDIYGKAIHRYHPDSGELNVYPIGDKIGSLAFRKQGGFVAALKHGFAFWQLGDEKPEYFADPQNGAEDSRFNDGAVDRHGRYWAGTQRPADANLFRLDPDLSVKKMVSDITISNGLGWSPDDTVMYYIDSPARKIYAYDYDAETGEITNQRVFAQLDESDGVPDGLTVDQDGYIWNAIWGGWRIIRYAPDGSIDCEIKLPVEFPTSCTFGGKNLDELYITSAWTQIPPEKRGEQPLAGDVFRIRVGVKGFPEPEFAG